jgi:hypothetical protein
LEFELICADLDVDIPVWSLGRRLSSAPRAHGATLGVWARSLSFAKPVGVSALPLIEHYHRIATTSTLFLGEAYGGNMAPGICVPPGLCRLACLEGAQLWHRRQSLLQLAPTEFQRNVLLPWI